MASLEVTQKALEARPKRNLGIKGGLGFRV